VSDLAVPCPQALEIMVDFAYLLALMLICYRCRTIIEKPLYLICITVAVLFRKTFAYCNMYLILGFIEFFFVPWAELEKIINFDFLLIQKGLS
jgi:hypothetical protein